MQNRFASVLAFVAAAAIVEAEKSSAQCGPSLLQVSAVRRKVFQEKPSQEVSQEEVDEAPTGLQEPPEASEAAPESSGKKKHQLLLEAGTLTALVLLLGAGLYHLGKGLGINFSGWMSATPAWMRATPAWMRASSERDSGTLSMAAWGENVQNEYCDYVMVFSASSSSHCSPRRSHAAASINLPNAAAELTSSPYPDRIVDGFEMAKKAFLDSHRHQFVSEEALREHFQDGMTLEAYQNAACDLLLTILTSAQLGLTVEQFTNADNDKLFWRVDLDKVAVKQYAAHYRYPVSLNNAAYDKAGVPVPTNWDEEKVYAFYPYMPKWSGMYKDMTQTDRLKLMSMRIKRYANLDALMEQHVLLQHFAVHDLEEIGYFVRTWGSLRNWFFFPRFETIDRVRGYFGEQVGFMFMWQRFYLGALLVPAIVGGVVFFRRFVLPERTHSTVQMVFAAVMSVWATIFNASYARFEQRTRQRWGTSEFKIVSLDLQHGYDAELRGSWRVFFVFVSGDLLTFSMMLLSILCNSLIQYMRFHHHDMFGSQNRWYVEKGAGLVTAIQILCMDMAWQLISYAIVNSENHRLRSDWWDAWIKRMVTVRVFTNLYPFIYVGFLKEYTGEGCPKSGRGCLDELQTNLMIFFGVTLASNLAQDIGFIAYARMQHAMERSSLNNEHMSLQVQATLYDYNAWVFINDWTRQVTTFLLLICFNVVLPVISVFVLLTTMFEARLMAHRICCHLQRPFPQAAEGIGSWQDVLEVMTLLGVLITSSFAIFVMQPLRQRALWEKVVLFVVAEHMLLFLNLFVRAKFPRVPPDVHEVVEQNERMLMSHFIDPSLHIINVPTVSESIGAKLKRVVAQAQKAAVETHAQTGRPDNSKASSSSSQFPPDESVRFVET